ncbi:MAG: NPCBM/NEW2 domain-containing protein, partial [Clostridia bacterium]|nr:NPCBM/NEW2 domain-containing protein [Clostridia bacterium]
MKVFAAESSNDDKVLYLSDKSRIQHDAGKSKADRNKLFFNQNDAGDPIRVKIEGAWYTFENGIYAHGPSYVAYNVSEFSQKYEYFSAYGGLLPSATKSDGALFYFQTSEDGTKWVTQAPSDTSVTTDANGRQLVKYNQNALYFTYKITGVKWIRLVADKNGGNAQDYVVWADAKLTTTLDEGEAVKSLAAYDTEIKAKVDKVNLDAIKNDKNADLFQDEDLEKLVLQREFVSRVGQYALKRFRSESADNIAMLDWLLDDLDSLREFMLGGTPFKGNYYNSLTVLSQLYKSYKNDLDDKTLLGYNHKGNKWMPNRTFGELCRTMMFSVALTHDGAIGSYLQGSKPENKSYPLQRYAI